MSVENIEILGKPVTVEPPEFYSNTPTTRSYPRQINFGDAELVISDDHVLPLIQARVMVCGAIGYSAKETAGIFGVAPRYIRQVRSEAFETLGAVSMEQAVDKFFEKGFISANHAFTPPSLLEKQKEALQIAGSSFNLEDQAKKLGIGVRTLELRRQEITRIWGVRNMAGAILLDHVQKSDDVSREIALDTDLYYIKSFPTHYDDTIEWQRGVFKLPHNGFFSETERLYLGLAAIGLTNEEIATHADSSASTVQHQFSQMYKKLDLDDFPKDVKRMLAVSRSFEDGHMIIDRYNDLLTLKPLERIILQGYADGKVSAQVALDIPSRFGKFSSGAVRNITSELNSRLRVPNTIGAVALAYLSGNIKSRGTATVPSAA